MDASRSPSTDSHVTNYRYRAHDLSVIWTSSVPKSDMAAIIYVVWVAETFGVHVAYLEKRPPGESSWYPIDIEDTDDEESNESGEPGEPGALDQG